MGFGPPDFLCKKELHRFHGAIHLFCSQILDPFALFDHCSADEAFDQIQALTDGVQGNNGYSSESTEKKCQRNTYSPHKAAVKQEGDPGFAAGPQGEIGGMDIGVEGNHQRRDEDQLAGKGSHLVGGVVQHGECSGKESADTAKHTACHNGQEAELAIVVSYLIPADSLLPVR